MTTPWRALAQACLPDEQKLSRGRSAESPVKPLVRKGMWCPSNGSHRPPGIASADRQRLDFVIYGATPLGGAICCDATLVSPLRRDGTPHAQTSYPPRARPRGRSVPLRARMRNWRTLERLSNVACAAPGRAALLPGPTGRARPRPSSLGETMVECALLGRAAGHGLHGTRPSTCGARASAESGASL